MSTAHVLVAYCTRSGSTAGVAARIAAGLRDHGHRVDLRTVSDAGAPGGHDAVVLGSPVFDGRWMPEADAYAAEHAAELTLRAVWIFSVGTFGDTKRLRGPLARREPRNIDDLRTAVRPRGYRVFAGAIDRDAWPRMARLVFHAIGGRFGDNRDWAEIDRWAAQIAEELDAGETRTERCAPRSTPTA